MNKTQRNRLLKVAEHLETGKLGHEKFDFSCINDGPRDKKGCGTLGCALGEFPIIFSRHFRFCGGDIIPKGGGLSDGEWLGIDNDEFYHLFFSGCQDTKLYGGRKLSCRATRKQVAANMRAFLKIKK